VRRISFGITTRPKSSIRRTIPVAFISVKTPLSVHFTKVVFENRGILSKGEFGKNDVRQK